MLKNYFLLSIRQLLRNKLFSLINIVGLSLSMVACLLIFKYVSFEKSYDAYHEEVENLYRIYRVAENGQDSNDMASIFPGIAPKLKDELPEIISATRFIGSGKIFQSFALSYSNPNGGVSSFNITRGHFTDHDALDIFNLEWVEGEGMASLSSPDEIVISRSVAQKFFGNEPALGKVLRFKNMAADFKVTGVYADLPENTHFKFEVLISFETLPDAWNLDNDFGWGNFYTYVRLTNDVDKAALEAKMNELLYDKEEWYETEGIQFKLQALKDIHLTSNLSFELEANGNESTVKFLTIIGFFIMIIAWVNYINLSTSKLVDRSKEVGIRKVLGSYKRQLISQFLTESLLINIISIALTLTLLQVTLGFFESLLGIPLNFLNAANMGNTLMFIGFFSLGSVFFGFYPALLFSNVKVTQVLKGKSKVSRGGLALRKGLTVFQFSIALILIIGTVAVYKQLNYMQNRSLGINLDQTVVVRKPFMDSASRNPSHEAFVNGLEKLSTVGGVAASSEIPGQLITRQRSVNLDQTEESHGIYVKDISVDEHFFGLYEIELLHGRYFRSDDSRSDIILNESAARDLFGTDDLANKINQTYYYLGQPATLVGIIADYNQESLKTVSQPHVYSYANRIRYYSIKVNAENVSQSLEQINEIFEASYTASHFDYFFLDSFFDRQYRSDRLFGRIFAFFSVLAIVITILGLFGLSLYNVTQRAKEVSVRKVLGASIGNLSVLLTREYLYLIGMAALVSVPLGYLLVNEWLDGFAYRTSLGLLMFVMPLVLVSILTLLTVGYQVLKTALANPAETLRWE